MLAEETRQLVENKAALVSRRDQLLIDIDDDATRFVVTLQQQTAHGLGYSASGARSWAIETPGAAMCEVPGVVGNSYFMPAGFLTVLRCLAAFKPEQIAFANESAELTWKVVLQQFVAGQARAAINADWQANQTVPAHQLSIAPGTELAPYQEVAAHLGTLGDSFGLFMEQGTGKTPTAIATMCTWLEKATTFQRIVVVCPRNVVPNWIAELKAFSSVPIKIEAIRGNEIARIGKLAAVMKADPEFKAGIAVINYDGVMTMAEIFAAVRWDQVILDEAHNIKSPQSQRTRYFLSRLRDRAKHRLILTGTPIANTAMDLWSQLEFLNPAASGFPTFKAYKTFYARIQKNMETGFDQIVGMQHIPVLQEVLARNSFIIRKSEAMPWLPEKTYSIESVDMTPVQAEMYKQVATQLAVEIAATLDNPGDNRQLLVNNVLTKLLRLAQVTSGFIIWDAVISPTGDILRPRLTERFPVNPKIEWCVDRIKNHPPDEKILLWSWMTNDIKALSERLVEEGINHVTFTGTTSDENRVLAEKEFNTNPECRVFIGNPAAGGSGLNLLGHDPKNPDDHVTDATLSVYIAQNWNAVHRAQSEDRNHRRGTRKATHIVTLVCDNTIDEEIHERVSSKRQAALEISDIRQILSNLLGSLV